MSRLLLRPATLDDSEFLLALRNDPETVKNSMRQCRVTPEDHEAWLAKSIADQTRRIFIAEDGTLPVARGQLDEYFDGTYISVSVIASERGKGYGREVISELAGYAHDWTPTKPVRAEIKPENIASRKAFAAAGFRCILPHASVEVWEEIVS